MNWKCDLYCYEDASGGWTTHVAANRRKEPPPDWDFLGDCPADEIGRKVWIDKLLENHQRSMEWLETHPDLVRIELPYAGESFNDRTLDDFEARLHELRQLGYVFPDDIFETIAWERAHPEGEVEW